MENLRTNIMAFSSSLAEMCTFFSTVYFSFSTFNSRQTSCQIAQDPSPTNMNRNGSRQSFVCRYKWTFKHCLLLFNLFQSVLYSFRPRGSNVLKSIRQTVGFALRQARCQAEAGCRQPVAQANLTLVPTP